MILKGLYKGFIRDNGKIDDWEQTLEKKKCPILDNLDQSQYFVLLLADTTN